MAKGTKETIKALKDSLMNNKKKVAAGTGVAGYGAYSLMGDEEGDSRFDNMEVEGEKKEQQAVVPTKGTGSSSQTKVTSEVEGPAIEEVQVEKAAPYSSKGAAPKVEDVVPPNPFADVGSMPSPVEPAIKEVMVAQLGDLQTKNAALMEAYRKEKDNIKSKKMWDALTKGILQIAAGMYALKTGVHLNGEPLKLADFTNEYEAASKELNTGLGLNKEAYDRSLDLARLDDAEKVRKYNQQVQARESKIQDASRQFDRWKVGKDLQNQAIQSAQNERRIAQGDEQVTLSRQAGKREEAKMKLDTILKKSQIMETKARAMEKMANKGAVDTKAIDKMEKTIYDMTQDLAKHRKDEDEVAFKQTFDAMEKLKRRYNLVVKEVPGYEPMKEFTLDKFMRTDDPFGPSGIGDFKSIEDVVKGEQQSAGRKGVAPKGERIQLDDPDEYLKGRGK